MSDILLRDKTARQRIQNEINTNFFVEAGAGSGKTYSLVQRMVSMVEGGIDVRKICAITFTRAAAAEFYSRFHSELIKRSRDNNLDEIKRANIENAVKNIDLCFMGTIDSFCNLIISEHPGFAMVPSDSQIISDDEIKEVYLKELTAIAKGEYGSELQKQYKLFMKYNYSGRELFSVGAGIISKLRNCETILPEALDTDLDKRFADEKRELLLFLKKAENSGDFLPNGSEERFKKTFRENKYILEGSWNRRPQSVKDVLKDLTNSANDKGIRIDNDSTLIEEFPQFLKIYGSKKFYLGITAGADDSILDYIQTVQYYTTISFIVSAVDAISGKLGSEGNLTFFDYMFYLRNMLKKDAENGGKLIKHIYDRHSYFLIDEFQDTNPMQAEIFFYLAAKNPDPDWKKCVPRPGSIFVVGDPKQSIYRFTNADVTSYLNVKKMFEGETGEVLYLSRNFRSTKPICEYFNGIFSSLLPEDTDIQSHFELIPTEENETPAGCFGGVYSYDTYYSTDTHKDYLFDGQVTETEETKVICDIITNLVGNPSYLIKGREDKAPRMIEYRDFMVIYPAKSKIKGLTNALKEKGIPSKTEGYISFADCDALVTVSKLFSAVANPTQADCVYDALKGEYFGITEGEILQYINMGGKLNLYNEVEAEGCDRVKSALKSLRELAQKAILQSPAAVLSSIQKKLRLFEKTGSEYLECYYYAFELLRDAESKNEITSLKQAAEMLSKAASNNSKNERCISLSEKENRVHIANLHKVKGLEAEIVILAGAKKRKATPSIRTADTPEGRKNWMFSIAESGKTYLSGKQFEEEKNLEKDALDAESIRLRYVAATRARSALIISKAVTKSGADSKENFWASLIDSEKSSSAILLMDEKDAVTSEAISASELYIDEAETIVSKSSSKNKTFEIMRPSMLKVKSKTEPEDEPSESAEIVEDNASASYKGNAAVTGTIVHRLMEKLVSSKNRIDGKAAVNSIISEFGLENPVYEKILNEVYQRVQSGGYEQKNGMTKDIITELVSADEVYCEVPFCRREENEDSFVIWNGVMDVVYRKGDFWHIVDYKTNADPDDLDEKYKKQLDAYIDAFKNITGNDADALIYHIDI